jgi:hypothetical protein
MMASKMLPDRTADIALDSTKSTDALSMMCLATASAGLPSGGTVAAARTMPFITMVAVSGVVAKLRRNVFGRATMGAGSVGFRGTVAGATASIFSKSCSIAARDRGDRSAVRTAWTLRNPGYWSSPLHEPLAVTYLANWVVELLKEAAPFAWLLNPRR